MVKSVSDAVLQALRDATGDGMRIYVPAIDVPACAKEFGALMKRAGGVRQKEAKITWYTFTRNWQEVRNTILWTRGELAGKEFDLPTPSHIGMHIADRVGAHMRYTPPYNVLEPEAGTGSLLQALDARDKLFDRFDVGRVVAIEPLVFAQESLALKLNALALRRQADVEQLPVDFLANDSLEECFDLVVMHPPWVTAGHPNAWSDHIDKALPHLMPNGCLFAIIPDMPREVATLSMRAGMRSEQIYDEPIPEDRLNLRNNFGWPARLLGLRCLENARASTWLDRPAFLTKCKGCGAVVKAHPYDIDSWRGRVAYQDACDHGYEIEQVKVEDTRVKFSGCRCIYTGVPGQGVVEKGYRLRAGRNISGEVLMLLTAPNGIAEPLGKVAGQPEQYWREQLHAFIERKESRQI